MGGGTFLYEGTGVKRMKSNLTLLKIFSLERNSKALGVGIGIDRINDLKMVEISKKILNKFSYIIFRDSCSLRNAERIIGPSIYTKSIVLPDLAYGLIGDVKEFTKGTKRIPKSIGINFMLPLNCTDRNSYISIMRGFVARLIGDGFNVYIIVAQPNSLLKEAKLVSDIVPHFSPDNLISYNGDIKNFFRKMSSLELIVGSRLHILIAAHLLQKPFLNIEYQEKTRYFMQEIKYDENSFKYADIDFVYNQIVKGNIRPPSTSPYKLYKSLVENLFSVLREKVKI